MYVYRNNELIIIRTADQINATLDRSNHLYNDNSNNVHHLLRQCRGDLRSCVNYSYSENFMA